MVVCRVRLLNASGESQQEFRGSDDFKDALSLLSSARGDRGEIGRRASLWNLWTQVCAGSKPADHPSCGVGLVWSGR